MRHPNVDMRTSNSTDYDDWSTDGSLSDDEDHTTPAVPVRISHSVYEIGCMNVLSRILPVVKLMGVQFTV